MRLTFYLLREEAKADTTSLRRSEELRELTVKSSYPSIVSAYLIEGEDNPPQWLANLGVIVNLEDQQDRLRRRSSGVVVFVSNGRRVIAACFGTGFHALEPSTIERGFGLRVTANMVHRVRGTQTRGIAGNSRDQKTLLPMDGEFRDLNVEVHQDWIRQLSGRSTDTSFAATLTGSDSLQITLDSTFSIGSLGDKVSEVLDVYERTDYMESFPFLDQIKSINRSDPDLPALDQIIASRLRNHDPELTFAAPDPFEQDNLDHYELTCGNRKKFSMQELTPGAIFEAVDAVSVERNPMESIRVRALDPYGANAAPAHRLRSYVQAELDHANSHYLLSAGLWFSIQNDFVASIQDQISKIPDLTEDLSLPDWDPLFLKEDKSDRTAEGSYNKILASERGYALLDKDLAYFGPHEKLEICDLLTPKGEFLCVKVASQSAALSHLVAQAVDSAAAWGASECQDLIGKAWTELHGDDAVSLRRSDATFVLAIATAKPGRLSDSLFFFTKVQIANCMKIVERAGFSIALARINMKPAEAAKIQSRRGNRRA